MPHLEIHRRALKYLESLPRDPQERIKSALNSLLDNPYPHGALKVKGYEPAVFRIRIGVYRVLYHVSREMDAVFVVVIDKRSRAYE